MWKHKSVVGVTTVAQKARPDRFVFITAGETIERLKCRAWWAYFVAKVKPRTMVTEEMGRKISCQGGEENFPLVLILVAVA